MEPIAAGNASLAQASADGACQQLGGDSETRHLLHASACLSHSPAEEAEQEDTAAALRPGQPPAPSTTDQGHAGCIGPVAATRSFSSSSHHSMMVEPSPRVPPDQLLLSAEKAVSMRLLPPLLLLVIISYLDRTALSFASIQMSQDLNLSSSMYGLGSGAFFLAYAAGQIPSNFLLLRFGGPAWLAFISITWGVAASCMALVRGPVSFVLLRMLLGLAESGGLPGTWYYISCFYAADRTTVPYTVIETGITVVAAPIAAGLLMLNGKLGLQGWQWLFLVEGLPAILLGCFMTVLLPGSLDTAQFLSEPQRLALLKATSKETSALAPACGPASGHSTVNPVSDTDSSVDVCVEVEAEDKPSEAAQLLRRALGNKAASSAPVSDSAGCSTAVSRHHSPSRPGSATGCGRGCGSSSSTPSSGSAYDGPSWRSVLAVARNRVVLYAGSWRILHDIPGNGVLYWTPKIVQALLLGVAAGSAGAGTGGASSPGVAVVLFSAIPYAAASLVHLLNAWHSQRVGEAKLHIAVTWWVGALTLVLLPFAASGALSSGGAGAGGVGTSAAVAAFVLLTVAHCGVNGANGLQTGLVAGCLRVDEKALGLAMYNTIACMGSFLGPLLIGVIHDLTHGYSVAMWVLGCSLAAAAFMVYKFKGSSIHRC